MVTKFSVKSSNFNRNSNFVSKDYQKINSPSLEECLLYCAVTAFNRSIIALRIKEQRGVVD